MKSIAQIMKTESHKLVREKVRQALQPGAVLAVIEQEVQSIVSQTLNKALLDEQEKALGRKAYQRVDDPIYRNGFKNTAIPSLFGQFLTLRKPVLRQGSFKSQLLHAFKTAGSAAIALLAVKSWLHGSSTRAVASDVNSVFGTGLTHSDISTLSDHLLPSLEAWRSQPLPENIAYLLLDATYLPVRSNTKTDKQALLVAMGLDPDGRRHILGFMLGDRESEDSWTALIDELLARNLNRSKIKLVISDEHKGIEAAVEKRLGLPHQLCVIHLQRNTRHKIPNRDQLAFMADFKAIFWASSKEAALVALGRFESKWMAAYPRIVSHILQRAPRFMLFYDQPKSLWPTLKSTNLIERFNREIKKRFRGAGTVFSENELLKLFWSVTTQQEKSWANYRARGFKSLQKEVPVQAA
jgi:putative transposase